MPSEHHILPDRRPPNPFTVTMHGFAAASLLFIASCGGGGGTASSGSVNVGVGSVATTPNPTPTTPTTPSAAPAFGAQTHFAQGWNINLVPRISAAGLTEVRDELYWNVVEPTPGNFQFPASYDNYMAALKNAGINPLIELTFENKNYDGGNTPYTDAGFNAYARYATEVLKKYGPQIKAVEIWNEYNGSFAKGPATNDRAGTYVKMLRTAYQAIKSVRPDVTVVGCATVGVPMPYLERIFAAGGLNYMDAVSIHPYRSNTTPEGLDAKITSLKTLIAKHNNGQQKPIWVTEIGWSTRNTGTLGDIIIDETTQAKFLVRAYALLLGGGAERVYWYLFRDYLDFETMGLVRNDSGYSAKPAHQAMTTLIAQLRGATFVEREKTDANVYSMRFRNSSGQDVRVIWALEATNFTPGSSARIIDMLGNSRSSSGTIRLDDSPLIVTGAVGALPAATTTNYTFLTDAGTGFSSTQGANGWSYGAFVGDSLDFKPLTFRITDFKEEWQGTYNFISITADDQHPSATSGTPVAAVRRWTSNFSGRIRVNAQFRSTIQGDGVRLRILASGQVVRSATLGNGQSISASYDFEQVVQPGTTIDFAIDPGAAGNINNDVTATDISLQRVN